VQDGRLDISHIGCIQYGWIEKDDAAAKDLRQFIRDFFAC
jgi:hypothetical protein